VFNVAFRVDASREIGTGHVMRCLALADKFREQGIKSHFVMRAHIGNMATHVKDADYGVTLLPSGEENTFISTEDESNDYASWLGASWVEDAEDTIQNITDFHCSWLIADHYAIDEKWESRIKHNSDINIMVIDGLADRKHDCDILLDQNYTKDGCGRWRDLVSLECKMFIGPEYGLFRSEFVTAYLHMQERNGIVKRIFIAFGGVDKHNITQLALEAVINLNDVDISIDVVIGSGYQYKNELEVFCQKHTQITLHVETLKVALLMANADLAIGGGGTMMWERCYLGLPSIVIAIAENQINQAVSVGSTDAIYYLGDFNNDIKNELDKVLGSIAYDSNRLCSMSCSSLNLMKSKTHTNGRVNNHPVVEYMMENIAR